MSSVGTLWDLELITCNETMNGPEVVRGSFMGCLRTRYREWLGFNSHEDISEIAIGGNNVLHACTIAKERE